MSAVFKVLKETIYVTLGRLSLRSLFFSLLVFWLIRLASLLLWWLFGQKEERMVVSHLLCVVLDVKSVFLSIWASLEHLFDERMVQEVQGQMRDVFVLHKFSLICLPQGGRFSEPQLIPFLTWILNLPLQVLIFFLISIIVHQLLILLSR